MLDAQLSCHLGLRVQGRDRVAGQMQAAFSPATALCFRLPVLLSAWCWCQETGKLATNCSATPGHWKSLGGVQWADGLVQNSKVLVFVQPHGRVTATILYLWSTLSSLRQPLYPQQPPPHSLSPIIFSGFSSLVSGVGCCLYLVSVIPYMFAGVRTWFFSVTEEYSTL